MVQKGFKYMHINAEGGTSNLRPVERECHEYICLFAYQASMYEILLNHLIFACLSIYTFISMQWLFILLEAPKI